MFVRDSRQWSQPTVPSVENRMRASVGPQIGAGRQGGRQIESRRQHNWLSFH